LPLIPAFSSPDLSHWIDTLTHPTAPILTIDGLTIGFSSEHGWLEVVSGISLQLHPRRTLALLGESGCGKTLTALSILRLIDPPGRIASGSIRLAGREPAEPPLDLLQLPLGSAALRQARGERIAMIFQEPAASFTPVYTIGEQIVESIRAHRHTPTAAARKQALELLAEVGIADPPRVFAAWPHQLSGGMCQRAMIALALACQPQILIADEPTTALDVTIQAQVLELMQRVQQLHGTAILLITHDLGVVAEMADDVAVMYLGQVVEHGTAEQLFNAPSHPYTQGLFASVPSARNRRGELLPSIPGQVPEPGQWPAGCRFRGRCGHEFDACAHAPHPTTLAPGHTAACWLHAPAALREEYRA
jgi:oligopeptide/dipeptide ABC transporter ATP-binding protein